MAPLQPWPWSTWGLSGPPSSSEKAWCLRWSATQEITGPSIAAEPRIASSPCSQGFALKLRWVRWRWKPTVIPNPVSTYMPMKRKTSLQCRALPQTCQPARPIAAKGTSVTRPVMIRSRVSLATGWMSEGSGPAMRSIIRWIGTGKRERHGYKGSPMAFASTASLRSKIEARTPERPFAIEFWDGTRLPSTAGEGPAFFIRSPRAAAHALPAPRQLGLGRAYVSGEIEVDDMDAVIELLDTWQPPSLDRGDIAHLALGAVRAAGIQRPPRRPASELVLSGRRHSKGRDAKPVRHHYDVSNDFFALFLDESMTYSCAFFAEGARTLEEAQEEKLETVARKLALQEGDRR